MHTLSEHPFVGPLRVSHHRLDNGLQVLLAPDPSAPVFSFHTWYRVGSSDERPGITGIAHLFEHMMFKETEAYPDGHWSRVVEQAGSPDSNAFTWMDETVYTQSLPAGNLDLIASLEAVRMSRLVVDKAQLESEREVVINERRLTTEDDPQGRMSEALYGAAFDVHPYRWPTIGYRADLDTITVEDARRFYRDFYSPDNATLILSGDLQVGPALDIVQRHYGALPASRPVRPGKPAEPTQVAPRRKELSLQVESEMLVMGFRGPEMTHPDTAAFMVLDAVLDGGMASRLKRRLIDSGLAVSASAMLPPTAMPSLYEIAVTLRPGKAAATAEAIVWDVIASVAAGATSDADLERAKNRLLRHGWGRLESAAGRADFLGWNQVIGGDWRLGLDRLHEIEAVGSGDVARVARTWLRPEAVTVVVAVPQGRRLRRVAAHLPQTPASSGRAAPPPGRTARPPATQPGPLRVLDGPGGIRLAVSPDPILPVIRLQLSLPRGSRFDPEGADGLHSLTVDAMLRGTRRRDRAGFEDELERAGASFDGSASADRVSFGGSTLASGWPRFLDLVREALHEPSFDAGEWRRLKQEALAAIVDERNDDRSLASNFFRGAVYGDHPYHRDASGKLSTVPGLGVSQARATWKSLARTQGAVLGISGPVGDTHVEDVLRLLQGWDEGQAPVEPPGAPQPLPGMRLLFVDKPDRNQAQVMVGHPALTLLDPRYPAFAVGNNAFGGHHFTTRLMKEVREKRGWSYGAYGTAWAGQWGGAYGIWVAPGNDYASDCVALVLDLHREAAGAGLTEDEIAFGRASMINTSAFLEDTATKRLGGLMTELTTGYSARRTIEAARTVTPVQVNRAVSEVFQPGRQAVVVVGTASVLVDPLVRATGISEVQVVPYDVEL